MGSGASTLADERDAETLMQPSLSESELAIIEFVKGFASRLQEPDALQQLGAHVLEVFPFYRTEPCNKIAELLGYMKGPLEVGFAEAQIAPQAVRNELRFYLQACLAHHVMRCLLALPGVVPEPAHSYLEESYREPRLPAYSRVAVDAFAAKYLTLSAEASEQEKDFAAIVLADKIISVIQNMGIAEFIKNTCACYQKEKLQQVKEREACAKAAYKAVRAGGELVFEQKQEDDKEIVVTFNFG